MKTARVRPLDIGADGIAWRHYDLTQADTVAQAPPAPGELYVWLVSTDFPFASALNIGQWLSIAERRRARMHPRSPIGRRFGIARATLRLSLSHMLACAPEEVGLTEGPFERVAVASHDVQLGVDVAYAGIWIAMVIAACDVGVGLTVAPVSDDASRGGRAWAEAAGIARSRLGQTSEAMAHDHALTLPMPGGFRGVALTREAITRVSTFGFSRTVMLEG
ncbi:hypothetical protein QCE63_08455 [Caballeronia sp. LZ065]|uniref:hypothetical protein n=1 Tax=Caballeronia sp. LZ065 TaxID=3038571 RepID=UPI002859D198|nr:hypothetical protein [Caballeronia sp. LZ065]MDR5779459.1 hypothetical protein [Caballeronia sp. LZ065]